MGDVFSHGLPSGQAIVDRACGSFWRGGGYSGRVVLSGVVICATRLFILCCTVLRLSFAMVDACGVATVGWCYELVWIIRYFKSVWRWQELVLKGLKPPRLIVAGSSHRLGMRVSVTGLDDRFHAISCFRVFAIKAGATAVIEVFTARERKRDQGHQDGFLSCAHDLVPSLKCPGSRWGRGNSATIAP